MSPALRERMHTVLAGMGWTDVQDDESAPQRRIIWCIAIAFAAFFVWAAAFDLDVASRGVGEVAPAGQVKRVQHLEGGIVRQILVREGDLVRVGQPLIELEGTASQSERAEVESRIASLQIKVTRLDAQLSRAREVVFAADLEANYPDQVAAARELFHSQRVRLRTSSTGQSFRVNQRHAEIEEINSRIEQLSGRERLLAEQISISTKLLAEGLTNQYAHLELLKEQTNTQGQLAEARASFRKAQASLSQEEVARSAIDVDENEELRQELDESRTQLGELQERRKKLVDSTQRSVIRSPIDGSVLTLFVVTQGGVIPPGGTVMTLVPANDRLVVEAKLPVSDVGFVQPGQRARLQLMASAGRRLQPLDGKVIHVSPDAVSEPEKEPYVLVRIAPAKDRFESGSFVYRLTPGARVDAAIVTGERSVLGYLLDPFLSATSGAMMEP